MWYVMVSKKRIHYLCEGAIEKSVPRDHCLLSLSKPGDAKRRPRDGFFYPTLTLIMESYIILMFIFEHTLAISSLEMDEQVI